MGMLFIGLVILIIFVVFRGRDQAAGPESTAAQDRWRGQYDAGWAQFIASYREHAKTKAEKQLIERMLADLAAQGFPMPEDSTTDQLSERSVPGQSSAAWATTKEEHVHVSPLPEPRNVQLDNASLLLYFGAFLFVASVGLFVAFGGLSGTVRTFAVALVAAVLYGSGIWLFRHKTKLEQAGLAFAGIGLATAPFVGLAAYSFVFGRSSGAIVWFVTSLVCMGLYLHALFTLKKPLLNYILIFTFLSLVLSGIAAIDAPIYYFGWGLAAVGIVLSVVGRRRGFDQAFQDASGSSAKVFVPLASAASLVMIVSQGAGQLGISLLLAALYYAAEFRYGDVKYRAENAVASQVTALAAIGALVYAIRPEFWLVATVMTACNALQAVIVLHSSKRTEVWVNFASIMLAAGVVAVFLGLEEPAAVVVSLVGLVANSAMIWRKQERTDAYGLGVVAWMILPIVIGQLYLQPHMTFAQQTALSLGALLLQWTVIAGRPRMSGRTWAATAKVLYILGSASVLVLAYMAVPSLVCLLVAAAIASSMILLAEQAGDSDWATVAGFVSALPVLRCAGLEGWFAVTIILALATNIALALRYRQEAMRWLGSLLWLLLPISLGHGVLGQWTLATYGWAYMVVFAGFVLARAIARGILFVSGRVPVASYEKAASESYVVGYCLAGAVAVGLTLVSADSHIHTSLVLALLGLAIWLLAVKIERQLALVVLLPFVAQAILLSVWRPAVSSSGFDVYLMVSSLLAVTGYVIAIASDQKEEQWAALRDGSLASAGIVPLSFLAVGQTHLMMPIGLLLFAAMLYHRVRRAGQQHRELVGGLALISIWWLMWFAGVRNPQAYSHVLAGLFALYAYWRHVRQETATSDQYLLAMLATATIPLILHALSATAGGLYGWWLLLEQVFFMLLGMAIQKPLVVRWGLYVAVGAVIYQLRGLGWAALTVLAVFLIGLAIYRLQKQDKKK